AVAVVGIFGRLVVGVRRRAVNVGLNGLRDLGEVVVVGLADDASWIGRGLDPAGGVVGLAGDQHGVGARRHGAWPGVGRAAVGADIDGVREAVAQIVVVGDIGDAGLGVGRGVAQLASVRVVVEVVLGDDKDRIAIGVVLRLGLGQHVVAGDGAGVGVAR